MKKIFITVLCILIIIGICACSSGNAESNNEPSVNNTHIQTQTKDIPTKDLIRKDLEKALLTKNEYAILTDFETVKSLTGEGGYEITLSVNAETKYANWEYEVDMDYQKYDQGWMIDSVDWINENYLLIDNLDQEELCNYFSNYLYENEIFVLNTEKCGITYENPLNNATQLCFAWTIEYSLKHGYEETGYWTYWIYDPEIDNWVICSDVNHSENGSKPNLNLDFSGEWYLHNLATNEVISEIPIIISEFSWEGFYAEIPEFIDSKAYFIPTEEKPDVLNRIWEISANYDDFIFTDGSGKFITFEFNEMDTDIFYYDNETVSEYNIPLVYVNVISKLPNLE